jgi:protein MpaA
MAARRLELLASIYDLASRSSSCQTAPLQTLATRQGALEFPRFIFSGPGGGGDPVRFGVFAGIHGDEPAGVLALARLLEELSRNAELAEGYKLFVYPACNPTGLLAGTRGSETGKDLNREFWKDSSEPEVQLLENEIRSENFHGLISLHADDTSDGMYGFVRGAVLSKGLLEPALKAAERVIPRNTRPVIDGFPAENGIISECYDGILTSPPELHPQPFEIILETPHLAPQDKQVDALVLALQTILREYQKLLAFAANL